MGGVRNRRSARCGNIPTRRLLNKEIPKVTLENETNEKNIGSNCLISASKNQCGNPFEDLAAAAGENDNSNWADKIFGNDLIFKKIIRCLGVADLKILRQVSSCILDQVNDYKRFVNNLRITICKESSEDGVVAQPMIFWKKAKLYVEEYSSSEEIKDCLSSVDDLQILLRSVGNPTKIPRYSMSYIYNLVLQMDNLKRLSIPYKFLGWDKVISKTSKVLETLEEFHISQSTGSTRILPESNLQDIGSLKWKLKRLEVKLDSSLDINSAVVNIFKCCLNTLETIKLRNCKYRIYDFGDFVFPSLKSIEFHFYFNRQELLAAFLLKQPDLEYIKLKVDSGGSGISHLLLDAIRAKSAKLRTLILHGKCLSWVESFPDARDWEFLRECKDLKDFQIPGGKKKVGVYGHFYAQPWIQSLSSNIESVKLFNLICVHCLSPIAQIERLRNLTQLKLTSETGLDDRILQAICRTNVALRVFHFGIGTLSNFGITGEQEYGTENSGISLRNLKGLQDLTMFGRGRLTIAAIVKAIQMLELKQLSLIDTEIKMPKATILEIAKNNPSLEFLDCIIPLSYDLTTLLCEIKAVNKRLTNLGVQKWGHYKVSCKPSYGILSNTRDSEIYISKNEVGQCLIRKGPSPSTPTPSTATT